MNVTITGSYTTTRPEYGADGTRLFVTQENNLVVDQIGNGVVVSVDDNNATTNPYDPSKFSQTFEDATGGSLDFDMDFGDDSPSSDGVVAGTLQLDVSMTTISTITPQVSAQYNGSGTGPAQSFGPYLQGVSLPDTFTVSVGSYLPGFTEQVSYAFTGQTSSGLPVNITSGTATPGGQGPGGVNQLTFKPDVGDLNVNVGFGQVLANTLDVTIQAVSSDDEITLLSLSYPVSTLQQLQFDLTANGPGGGADTTNLRFISGVDVTPTFTETIPNLPTFYAPLLTAVQIEMQSSSGPFVAPTYQNIPVSPTPASGGGLTFTFSVDAGQLYPIPSYVLAFETAPVVPVFATPAGPKPIPIFGNPVVQLITLPSWMGSNAASNASWNGSQYVINLVFPQNLSDDFNTGSGTPFGVFDHLDSGYSIGVDVTVTAALTYNAGDAQATPKDAFANATILNRTVLNHALFPAGTVQLSAPLDPKTLDLTSGITITSKPINLVTPNTTLFDIKFGDPGPGGAVPFTVPSPVPLAGSLSLSGEFRGFVNYVTLTLGLTIINNNGLQFSPGSFIELDASAGATLQLNAGLGLGFTILPGFSLFQAVVSGAVGADVNAHLRVDLKNSVVGPGISLDPASWAGVAVAAAFDYNFSLLSSSPIQPVPIGLTPDDIVGHTGLFGLPEPSQYSFGLTGPGNSQSPAIPGVSPSVGSLMSFMGPQAPASPGSLGTQDETPTATLASDGDIFAPVDDIHYDVNVLADHATLTPGHHFLDTELIAPDGTVTVVSHQDLSSADLQPNANPLGYASGWTTVAVDLSQANLQPAVPYQVAFVLTDDLAGTGQAVAVAMDNIVYDAPQPALAISPPSAAAGSPIDLASGSATITLANTGTAALDISALDLSGTGATFAPSMPSTFDILPGYSFDVVVDRTSPTDPVSATLSFATNDPNSPTVQLALIASSLQATAVSDVTAAGVYGGTATVSAVLTASGAPLVGQSVAFTIEIGGVSTPLGTGTTDASGLASLTGVSLAGIGAGEYPDAVTASFALTASYGASGGNGTLTVANVITEIGSVSPSPRNTAVAAVDVTFAGAVNAASFPTAAVTLTDNGQPVAVSGLTLSPVSGFTYAIQGLAAFTKAEGQYALTVNAADIPDQDGVEGSGSASTSWLIDTTPPISSVAPLPRQGTRLGFSSP